jgi:hypothetical protein
VGDVTTYSFREISRTYSVRDDDGRPVSTGDDRPTALRVATHLTRATRRLHTIQQEDDK